MFCILIEGYISLEYELQKARSAIAENEKIRRFSHEYKSSAHGRGELPDESIVQPDLNTPEETYKLDQPKKKSGELFHDKRRLLLVIIIVLSVFNVFSLPSLIYFWIRATNDHGVTSPVIKQSRDSYCLNRSLF